jgi:hypothetical protein
MGFTEFKADEFEDMAVGSNISLTVVPWTSGEPCPMRASHCAVVSLITLLMLK